MESRTTDVAVPAEPLPLDVGEAVLTYLGLDPRAIETRALVLLCERYRLDPLLGHAGVISTKQGFRPYITRDGMLEVAHRSGLLDGIVVDEERRNSDNNGFTAYVSVWRKDMSHPFRYGAQCKDSEFQARNGYGAEQALARAERRALRRAFSIPAYGDEADADNGDAHVDDVDVVAPASVTTTEGPAQVTDAGAPLTTDQRDEIRTLFAELGITDAAEQLAYAGGKLGRTLAHPGTMTYTEGETLIAALTADAEAPL